MDRWLTRETGVPAYIAEEPIACVAKGAAKALTIVDRLRRVLPAV
jgi:rod shape-determining protein MreB